MQISKYLPDLVPTGLEYHIVFKEFTFIASLRDETLSFAYCTAGTLGHGAPWPHCKLLKALR